MNRMKSNKFILLKNSNFLSRLKDNVIFPMIKKIKEEDWISAEAYYDIAHSYLE